MKKSVIVFLLSVWMLVVPSAFAGSRAVIHGIIEPVVIPEVVSMQMSPEAFLQAGTQPSFDTNASQKDFVPQTVVEHIGGVTVYTFVVL